MKKVVQTQNAPKPRAAYSQAIKAGRFLFVSGQVAIDPKEGKMISGNIKEQTRRVMENIRTILETEGYALNDIVQSNVFLKSMNLFSEFNGEYAKYFEKELPARVTVGVEVGIEGMGALVEISVVAYK